MSGNAKASHRDMQRMLGALFEELLAHDGFGEFRVEFRILKRGQKEIIIHCGKQYRYVVDFKPASNPQTVPATAGSSAPDAPPVSDPEAWP